MNPTVSWLMPAYHAENTIERAICSMLGQSFQDFEIIIVLEPDDKLTEQICTQYAEKDSRIQIFTNKEKSGIAASLNVGIMHCKGIYIARMDADDISYPERLEKQVQYMETHPDVGLLGTNARMIKYGKVEGLHDNEILDSETIRARLLFENCIIHPTVMLRKNAYPWVYPLEAAEDYALFTKMVSKVKMEVLQEPLIDYVESGRNACIANFDHARKSGYAISRKVLWDELHINTTEYEDSHFGWRYYDDMPQKGILFLEDSLRLLHDIWKANENCQVFCPIALSKTLERQWELSKWLIRPYNGIPRLYKKYDESTEKDVQQIDFQLDLYTNSNKRIVIYGIGRDCEKIIKQLETPGCARIVAFCDSDEKKQGGLFYGKQVVAPGQLKELSYDAIGISTRKYEKEIRTMLISQYGLKEDHIYTLSPDIDYGIIAFHRRLEERKKQYHRKRRKPYAWLFCAPDYGNLGDHAIAKAEHHFFEKFFGMELIEVPCAEYRSVIAEIKELINPSDLIIITGGGFSGSLWIDIETQAREVIRRFSQNPVCILPQTVYWESGERWEIEQSYTKKVYYEHKGKLLFCARDEKSQEIIHTISPELQTIICPDMTLSMDWEMYFSRGERSGALLCLKEDKESVLNEENKAFLEVIGKALCGEVYHCSTNMVGYFSEQEREDLLTNKLNEFARAEIVITDRLHGLLFSVITGTPCIALDNCNHKIRETFQWVKNINNIYYAKSMAEVEEATVEVLKIPQSNYRWDMWKRDFEQLRSEIQKIL